MHISMIDYMLHSLLSVTPSSPKQQVRDLWKRLRSFSISVQYFECSSLWYFLVLVHVIHGPESSSTVKLELIGIIY